MFVVAVLLLLFFGVGWVRRSSPLFWVRYILTATHDQVRSERWAHLGVTYALDIEYRRQPSYTHVAAAAAAAYRTQQLGSKISNTYWVMGNPCTVASTTVPTLLMAVSVHHLPLSSSPPTSSSFFSGQACGHSCLHVRKWKKRYYHLSRKFLLLFLCFYFLLGRNLAHLFTFNVVSSFLVCASSTFGLFLWLEYVYTMCWCYIILTHARYLQNRCVCMCVFSQQCDFLKFLWQL